ncbi:MAG: DUF4156 domain-containing protein [Mariprofundaceae bacterium]|nr:DUF4156 domain-containing protein [Mariprofundaceae bacterium]
MKPGLFLTFLSITLLASGCTWVKPTPQGEQIRVLNAGQVTSCKKIGKTTVSVLAKVAFVKRSEKKIKRELETMARNSASSMGGDTVVPVSEISAGEQSFDVYKCANPEQR